MYQQVAILPSQLIYMFFIRYFVHIIVYINDCLDHIYMLVFFMKGHIPMNRNQTSLARKQLEKRLAPLRTAGIAVPPRGWTKAIREALGMTARQLAARMGVSSSRIPVIEKAEVTGATTIRTLRETAEAMNCSFVYAFVPTKPLDQILRERAMQKAGKDMARLDHTMRLENQALLKSDLDDEQRRMVELILSGSLKGLWEDK